MLLRENLSSAYCPEGADCPLSAECNPNVSEVWNGFGFGSEYKLVCPLSYDRTYVKFSISAGVPEVYSRDFYTYQLILGISLKLAIWSDILKTKRFFLPLKSLHLLFVSGNLLNYSSLESLLTLWTGIENLLVRYLTNFWEKKLPHFVFLLRCGKLIICFLLREFKVYLWYHFIVS